MRASRTGVGPRRAGVRQRPRVMVVGLAPAAHGANRTGRVFTGDRSGDFLFAALHRAGLANQALCVDAADGLALNDTRIVAAVRCAPPGERADAGRARDVCAVAGRRVAARRRRRAGRHRARRLRLARGAGHGARRGRFGRPSGAEVRARRDGHAADPARRGDADRACYHPSQQNTFTGKLTPAMLDDVFGKAADMAGVSDFGARSCAQRDQPRRIAGTTA